MDHKERFYATLKYEPVDRPASWLGLPVPYAEPALMKYFRVNTIDGLQGQISSTMSRRLPAKWIHQT